MMSFRGMRKEEKMTWGLHTQRKCENGEKRDFSDDERCELIEYLKTLK